MKDDRFPFPDRDASFKILRNDPCFGKIRPEDVDKAFDEAWNCGVEEASRFVKKYGKKGSLSMFDVYPYLGFQVESFDKDYVMGGTRYFCEYTSKGNHISIYSKSVELWARSNGFTYEDGLNLILAHEFYHYLEAHEIGYTSKHYLVPMVKIGPVRIGKTGVPALSEVAANAFANGCYSYLFPNGRKELEPEQIESEKPEKKIKEDEYEVKL